MRQETGSYFIFFPDAICTWCHLPNIDISNMPSAKWT